MKEIAIKRRKQIRLKNYDYSSSGSYFVTICTQNRACLFGDTMNGEIRLNESGQLVQSQWNKLPKRFPNIELYDFVVMPNHIHGIITIVGAIHELPLHVKLNNRIHRRNMLLPKIIGYFKMNVAKCINQLRNTPGICVWQRNYYEHIIRNEYELHAIRQYIWNNVQNWDIDRNNIFGEKL